MRKKELERERENIAPLMYYWLHKSELGKTEEKKKERERACRDVRKERKINRKEKKEGKK